MYICNFFASVLRWINAFELNPAHYNYTMRHSSLHICIERPHTCFLCSTFCTATTAADECLHFPIRQHNHRMDESQGKCLRIDKSNELVCTATLSIRIPHRHTLSLQFNPNAMHAENANKHYQTVSLLYSCYSFLFILHSDLFGLLL